VSTRDVGSTESRSSGDTRFAGAGAVTETDVVKGIRSEYQYGFANSDEAENYFYKSGRGLSH